MSLRSSLSGGNSKTATTGSASRPFRFRPAAAVYAFFHPTSLSEVQATINDTKKNVESYDETLKAVSEGEERTRQLHLESERIQQEVISPTSAK